MKIKLYKKAPKCPKCKVSMKSEGTAYTDEQEKRMSCEHDWKKGRMERDEYKTFGRRIDKCRKCGETRTFQIRYKNYNDTEIKPIEEELGFMYIPSAELYRCLKCLNLYKVEGD